MLRLNLLSTGAADFPARLAALLAFENTQDESIDRTVAGILEDVRRRGDDAVLEYTRRFDRVQAQSMADLAIPRDEAERAFERLAPARREALVQAAGRIRA